MVLILALYGMAALVTVRQAMWGKSRCFKLRCVQFLQGMAGWVLLGPFG